MGKNRNRNKYRQPDQIKQLPLHVIEHIVSKCDRQTQASCKIVCKKLNEFIGDISPTYIKNQKKFIETLDRERHVRFFYMSVVSKKYHMIVSDEDEGKVQIDIITRGTMQKPIRRTFQKQKIMQTMNEWFKSKRIIKGIGMSARHVFNDVFS